MPENRCIVQGLCSAARDLAICITGPLPSTLGLLTHCENQLRGQADLAVPNPRSLLADACMCSGCDKKERGGIIDVDHPENPDNPVPEPCKFVVLEI